MASNLAHCNCSHPPGSAEGLGYARWTLHAPCNNVNTALKNKILK